MQRFATGPVIVVFSLFAAWITYNATRVVIAADDRPAVFWTAIAILYAIAAAAGWIAIRLYRIRQAKGRKPLTNG